jgi:excisionase family DNA binding protein
MTMKAPSKEFLTVTELAELLGDMPVQTLYLWNHLGTGPPRYRVGNRVLYRRSDVDGWLEEHRVEPDG